ncbi:WD40 repeat domain-containing protein [uncultured Methanofollis sp.]|uniref:WD40 repeat domain-containing protein n=1 Tax=uncultured Methanofollis sp. TaxID=262500 RepID=UPI00260A8F1F|nr:PQQ-binding-like beta-propeller repeat protein [uncultured Methanofollis sp.]
MVKKAIVLACIVLLFCPSLAVAEETGEPVWETALGSRVVSTSITANGDLVAAGTQGNGGVVLLDHEGKNLWNYPTGCPVFQVSASHDGKLIAVAADKVRVLNRNGDIITQVEDDYYAYGAAISGDGKYIAAGYDNNHVVLLTTEGKRRWTQVLDGDPKALALSSDGSVIAVGSKDAQISVFDTQGTPLWTFDTGKAVTSISVSPEGDYVAAGSLNYFVYFFDRNGTVLWKHNTHERVYGVAVSSNGAYVAAASGTTVTLFTSTGDIVRTYDIGHPVFGAAITPDGTEIAVGTGAGGEGAVLLRGADKTVTPEQAAPENISAPREMKSMAATGQTDQNRDTYLLRYFLLKGEDYVPEIAHEFDGATVAGIVRQDDGTGVAVRMTVEKGWAEDHGGSEKIHLVTVAPNAIDQFPLRAEVLKTKFVGYDPEDRLVFEGYSPYPVTKYGVMAEGEENGGGPGEDEEIPLPDLFWREGHDNATGDGPVDNGVSGNKTVTSENFGDNTTGSGTFPTLPLQIPLSPSFQE